MNSSMQATIKFVVYYVTSWVVTSVALAGNVPSQALTHFGMCDASAGVAVGADLFLVANDEDNVLRLYRRDRGGAPVGQFDMNRFLRVESEHPETDIEGAARLGQRVYWITSHGRNKNGKLRPNRYRLFATSVRREGDQTTVAGVGRPYARLLEDLLAAESLKRYRLREASRRAPKQRDAVNIEGLAATPEGQLLIGFRNPIRRGQALVVPLENPGDVIAGDAAMLGESIELDLGGLGIRSLEHHAGTGDYLIVAGPYNGGAACQCFRWSGRPPDEPRRLANLDLDQQGFENWTPEALMIYADRPGEALILSDDGTRAVDGVDCKALPDERQRSFRSGWIRVD